MTRGETAYVRSAVPNARQFEGETVMFHPGLGKYHALDAIGSRVWAMLERPTTIAQVCEQLRTEFDVDADTCAADVSSLIDELVASQLVEGSD